MRGLRRVGLVVWRADLQQHRGAGAGMGGTSRQQGAQRGRRKSERVGEGVGHGFLLLLGGVVCRGRFHAACPVSTPRQPAYLAGKAL